MLNIGLDKNNAANDYMFYNVGAGWNVSSYLGSWMIRPVLSMEEIVSSTINEELQFKVSARRNKYIGEWASKILGYNTDQEKDYIQSVIKADFAEAGDEDVFRKVKEDLKDHNISDEDIRKKMDELNEKAKSDFK